MKVKKYMVKNISEAMEQIRGDFGDDAYILDTKKIKKGGFLGIGSKKYVEVTVLSEKAEEKNKNFQNEYITNNANEIYSLNNMVERNKRLNQRIEKEKNKQVQDTEEPTLAQELLELIDSQREVSRTIDKDAELFYKNKQNNNFDDQLKKQEKILKSENNNPNNDLHINSKDNDLEEIKKMISQLNKNMNKNNNFFQEVRDILIKNDFSDKIVEMIYDEIQDLEINENWREDNNFILKIKNILMKNIIISEKDLEGKVMLIGPTGIGKTTTLAKLAAISKKDNKKVAIVTIDTYRIAAADQLKIYADIMGIPAHVCYTPMDLKTTLESLVDYDTILIDTAGRSHKNDIQLGELKVFIDTVKPDFKILAISSNIKTIDAINIYEKFSIASPNALIFTKKDETSTIGQYFSLINYSKLPLLYITNGQKVPDDIKKPNISELIQEVLEEVKK
jgi:flagellar biosynthesis protein FlhF